MQRLPSVGEWITRALSIVPLQPSEKSIESSRTYKATRFVMFTAPPKNSTPSS
jgi:hypothetical protein